MDFMVCRSGDADDAELLHYAATHGIGLELQSYGLRGVRTPEDWDATFARHREMAAACPHRLAVHGPFIGIRYVNYDWLLRDAIAQRMDMLFDVVATLKADTLVLHTGYSRDLRAFELEERWVQGMSRYWQREIGRWESIGVTVVLENLLMETPDLLVQIVDSVKRPSFGVCLDVGHVNVFSTLSAAQWVAQLGPRLKHVHLHDNRGERDEHLPVGQGTLDVDELFEALHSVAPAPTVSLEVEAEPAVVLENLRDVVER